MKKNRFYGQGVPFHLKKLLFIMKLCLFFVLVLHFGVTGSTYAQQNVSIAMKNVSLEKVLKELKVQTGLRFFYSVEKVQKERKEKIDIKEKPLSVALHEILQGTGLTFTIMNDVVVIKDEVISLVDSLLKKSVIVRGIVKDKDGNVLPGVTVLIKGTKVGVATNVDGVFEIGVNDTTNLVLEFSFIGMETGVAKYSQRSKNSPWVIILKESVNEMDEVVVTGYQTLKKSNVAGAISTITKDDLVITGITSLEQMLQGKLPGVSIQVQSGLTGVKSKVRVRGTSTLLGNQDPIWVVDGIIQEDPLPFEKNEFDNIGSVDREDFDLLKDFVGTAIGWLSPYDIETISVLKDASATAIYGTKAANGVIVITTKKGEKGHISVNYNGSVSITPKLTYDRLELMNSKERVDLSREAFKEGLLYNTNRGTGDLETVGYEGALKQYLEREIDLDEFDRQVKRLETVNTDWMDILFRNAVSTNHNIGFSGGSNKISYHTSMGIRQVNNTAKGNDITGYNANLSLQADLLENLFVRLSLAGSKQETKAFYQVSPYEYATSVSRAIPCFDENGNREFYKDDLGFKYNVLHELSQTGNKNRSNTLNLNFNLNWTIYKGLVYEMLLGESISNTHAESYASELSNYISRIRGYEFGMANQDTRKLSRLPHGGQLNSTEGRNENYTWRNTLWYGSSFENGHSFNVTVGLEVRGNKYDGSETMVFGYFPDRGKSIDIPPLTLTNSIGQISDNPIYNSFVNRVIDRKSNYMSYFAIGTYSYFNRYVLNASMRTDASNRFGVNRNHRFQPVWSAGVRWNVHEENWLREQHVISLLALRATYGFQGNVLENYGPDLIVKMLAPNNFTDEYQVSISRLPFKDLTWEKSQSIDLGFDLMLWGNRLNLTIDYYYKKTTDAIVDKAIPYEYGTLSMPINSGTIENKGIEVALVANLIKTKDFVWGFSINYAKNLNKIKRADIQNITWMDAVKGNLFVEKHPVSGFWAFDYEHLDDKGLPVFACEEEGALSDYILDNMKYMGKLDPDFTGGFTTQFRYRGLSLSASFNVQIGGKKFLAPLVKSRWGMLSAYENSTNEYTKRWREPGDEEKTDIPGIKALEGWLYYPDRTQMITRMDAYNNSDLRVVKASFLKCNSIQIGYIFPKNIIQKLHVKGLSLSGTISQPFQIVSKDFRGRDPEVATGAQPIVSSYTLNLNLSF